MARHAKIRARAAARFTPAGAVLQTLNLVSFDPLRTLDIPDVHPLKPEAWFRAKERVRAADWVLFPEYWQVNALAYGWKKRLFPSLASYHVGHDKIEMTRAFEAVCPAHVPQTLILPATPAAAEEVLDTFAFPFVAKSPRSSMGQGVWLIDSRAGWRAYAAGRDLYYVQEYLPLTRDLRVVWIGDRVLTAYWREAPPGGFHHNVARGGRVVFCDVPDAALALVASVARELGVDHAGFDVAWIDGHAWLLEFNVRFGTEALGRCGLGTGPAILDWLRRSRSSPPRRPRGPRLRRTG